MPTYNPYYHVGGVFGDADYRYIQSEPISEGQKIDGAKWRDFYWTGKGRIVDEWPEGDDAKIVMDQALGFIEDQTAKNQQFLSIIWFHNVHTPVVAGDKHRSPYLDLSMEEQHWYGCITAMDDQIGRLRSELKRLGINDNTIVWFCSDNGPSYIHNYNSAGPFKGKKAELHEGGICVPSILEWPAKFSKPVVINTPLSTSDFYPTILNLCGINDLDKQPYIDGEDVLPILLQKESKRKSPIGFQSPLPNRLKKDQVANEEQFAWIGNQYKLLSMNNGVSYQLYDIINDKGEDEDLSDKLPEIKKQMIKDLTAWSKTLGK